MSTQQIPREQWADYFEGFSAHNQTRCLVLDLESSDLGPQRIVDHAPLLAIEPDVQDDLSPTITIIAGDPAGGAPTALTHQVLKPTVVWVKQDDMGEVEAMDIEGEDGKVILQFCNVEH